MHSSLRLALAATLLLSMHARAQRRTYIVDCNSPKSADNHKLHSLEEVNALKLEPHDSVLFQRDTVCHGSLHPQGSGFLIDAAGTGALPRIEPAPTDLAALTLFNQENISIASLDLRGGTTYGIHISGDKGTMHNLSLRNLTVSNVRGTLKHKESGLIVIHATSPSATFEQLRLDSIRAFDTTHWSGIFIAGGSREHPAQFVTVTHSVVHDVQGDGIVIFNAANSAIKNSIAWHTGMQHQQTIGTPNAIWTWQCNRCTVEENEAFLTDSPGVDGGAFDIDWGNTSNSVLHNFAHDTQGYCVSIFAANGPTKQSVVDGNLCLNNGRSPRLAQRQGAILLMSWNGGSIDGLSIANNRVDWTADGNTPVMQTGSGLHASNVSINHNEVHTTGTALVDPTLTYSASGNRYFLENATREDITSAQKQLAHETDATLTLEPADSALRAAATHASGWRLVATVPTHTRDAADLFINLKTAALEYTHAGLRVSLLGDADILQCANDWSLSADGVELTPMSQSKFSLKLISPNGKITHTWTSAAAPIVLGLALRQNLGKPVYGRLDFENIRATD